MKYYKYLLVLIISLIFESIIVAQKNNGFNENDFNLFLKSGIRVNDKENYANLFFEDNTPEVRNITYNGGLSFWVNWSKIHLISDVQISNFEIASDDNSELKVEEYFGSVSLGYSFLQIKRLKMTGAAGLSYANYNFLLQNSNNASASVSSYLNFAADSYYLSAQAWYSNFTLISTYALPVGNNRDLMLGIEFGYQTRVSDVEWERKGNTLEGPNLMADNIYANFTVGIGF